ncbi:TPA: ACT domain-containing protein [Candidatus Geothermarchaeota archaeon]|nr:ACT domain-containing protein [Candidatus Geothermarchaeota archaeon]HIQ13668.1 ACT domain-containing protein [Thermoprotei archaeon]
MINLLDILWEVFKDKPGQKAVVDLLIKYGLSVRDGNIYLGDIRIPFSSLAEAAEVDRRVIASTVKSIEDNPSLKRFFNRLLPAGPFLRDVARDIGYTVLVIIPTRDQPGIIAGVSTILARRNINIVQIIAEAPQLIKVQKMYIVVEGEVPGDVLNEIKDLEYVESLQIM